MLPRASEAADDWPCGLVEASVDGTVVAVNDTFLGWLGRERDEVIGRVRMRELFTAGGRIFYETHLAPLLALQGDVHELALDLGSPDGGVLPVLLNAVVSPAADGRPAVLRFAIFRATDRRSYERELVSARESAEAARRASEVVSRRLSLIADVNLALSGSLESRTTLDLDRAMKRLAELLATQRGDGCSVLLLDEAGSRFTVTASAHRRAGGELAVRQLAERLIALPAHSALRRALEAPEPRTFDDLDLDAGPGTIAVLPIRARGRSVATVLMIRDPGQPPYTESDELDFASLLDRVGIAIENLRLIARQRETAMVLQNALLTPPAQPPRLEVATRYVPGAVGAMVGGDWHDSLLRPDGTAVLVVGDVSGHDHVAAAAMGQLRGLIRTIAYTGDGEPAHILTAADSAAHGLQLATLATAVVIAVPPAGAEAILALDWSNAGHLPPILVSADGEVRILDDKPDLLLGVRPGVARRQHRAELAVGHTLLLYTDGLVESRHQSLDVGLAALAALLPRLAGRPLEELCDALVADLDRPERVDDVVLLAVRLNEHPA